MGIKKLSSKEKDYSFDHSHLMRSFCRDETLDIARVGLNRISR